MLKLASRWTERVPGDLRDISAHADFSSCSQWVNISSKCKDENSQQPPSLTHQTCILPSVGSERQSGNFH